MNKKARYPLVRKRDSWFFSSFEVNIQTLKNVESYKERMEERYELFAQSSGLDLN
jgi:hypothetical protein